MLWKTYLSKGYESYKDAQTPRDDRVLQDKAGGTDLYLERLWYLNLEWKQCGQYTMQFNVGAPNPQIPECKHHQWLGYLIHPFFTTQYVKSQGGVLSHMTCMLGAPLGRPREE